MNATEPHQHSIIAQLICAYFVYRLSTENDDDDSRELERESVLCVNCAVDSWQIG